MRKLLKYNLSLLLMLIILIITIATCILATINFWHSTNHSFAGDARDVTYPGLTLDNFKSRDFQNYIEALINKKLRFRNFLIGINGQLYYSLFKKSFAEDSHLIIGKHQVLFESHYIKSYCDLFYMPFMDENALRDWADKIKKLNDYYQAKGKTFIYLITPSKAEYMPEDIPVRFHCKNVGIRSHISEIKKLLTERHVTYVDAASLMVSATEKYHIPMFPQGGTHWNWLGSTVAANAIIQAINSEHKVNIAPIKFDFTMGKVDGRDSDDDLLSLIKLTKPPIQYLVPKVSFVKDDTKHAEPSLAIVGGSFNESLITIFLKNQKFSNIKLFFYYKTEKEFLTAEKPDVEKTIVPASPSTLNAIAAADIIILEENSSLTVSDYGNLYYESLFT